MLMLHRGHLGTLWVRVDAFDGRKYSKLHTEWMVERRWSKTSRTIIISHKRGIRSGDVSFWAKNNISSWSLPLDCPVTKCSTSAHSVRVHSADLQYSTHISSYAHRVWGKMKNVRIKYLILNQILKIKINQKNKLKKINIYVY